MWLLSQPTISQIPDERDNNWVSLIYNYLWQMIKEWRIEAVSASPSSFRYGAPDRLSRNSIDGGRDSKVLIVKVKQYWIAFKDSWIQKMQIYIYIFNRELVSTVLRVCFSFHRLLKGQHVFRSGTFSKNLSYFLLYQKFLWTTKFQWQLSSNGN